MSTVFDHHSRRKRPGIPIISRIYGDAFPIPVFGAKKIYCPYYSRNFSCVPSVTLKRGTIWGLSTANNLACSYFHQSQLCGDAPRPTDQSRPCKFFRPILIRSFGNMYVIGIDMPVGALVVVGLYKTGYRPPHGRTRKVSSSFARIDQNGHTALEIMAVKLVTVLTLSALAAAQTLTIPPRSGPIVSLPAPQRISGSKDFGNQEYDRGLICETDVEVPNPEVFILEDGASISNVIIGSRIKEGIVCRGACTLTNVWFRNVCESMSITPSNSLP